MLITVNKGGAHARIHISIEKKNKGPLILATKPTIEPVVHHVAIAISAVDVAHPSPRSRCARSRVAMAHLSPRAVAARSIVVVACLSPRHSHIGGAHAAAFGEPHAVVGGGGHPRPHATTVRGAHPSSDAVATRSARKKLRESLCARARTGGKERHITSPLSHLHPRWISAIGKRMALGDPIAPAPALWVWIPLHLRTVLQLREGGREIAARVWSNLLYT